MKCLLMVSWANFDVEEYWHSNSFSCPSTSSRYLTVYCSEYRKKSSLIFIHFISHSKVFKKAAIIKIIAKGKQNATNAYSMSSIELTIASFHRQPLAVTANLTRAQKLPFPVTCVRIFLTLFPVVFFTHDHSGGFGQGSQYVMSSVW